MDNLLDVNWLHIGASDQYAELKKDIGEACRDVTNGGCIDEICIYDILKTFERHGFAVVQQKAKKPEPIKCTCKTNGCLGGSRICARIADDSNQCRAHANYKCANKVTEPKP